MDFLETEYILFSVQYSEFDTFSKTFRIGLHLTICDHNAPETFLDMYSVFDIFSETKNIWFIRFWSNFTIRDNPPPETFPVTSSSSTMTRLPSPPLRRRSSAVWAAASSWMRRLLTSVSAGSTCAISSVQGTWDTRWSANCFQGELIIVLCPPMSSSCQKTLEILTFTWLSPDLHLTIMWQDLAGAHWTDQFNTLHRLRWK